MEVREAKAPEADLSEMEPAAAAAALAGESPESIKRALSELPPEAALEVASHLPAEAGPPPDSPLAEDLLKEIDGTVEQLMVQPFGVLPPDSTVASALDFVVRHDAEHTLTYLFITDDDDRLLGVVAMRDLLLARPGQTLGEIMASEPFTFNADTSVPEAISAALARRHRLYPVTADDGTLLGVVYGWRLFQFIATEFSAQSGAMVGVGREERTATPVLQAFRMRHPWLQVNLLTAFAAAFVVGLFEDTIARVVALAVFLPVLAGQSGNTGSQALAITLRSLTLGELADVSVARLMRKEIILGAMNGVFVGVIAAAAMWWYADMTGAGNAPMLALVILLAMVGACVGSGIFGVLVPLTLRRFGADPAMASSIFLTTFTDVLGMGLMLLLATTMVLG